MNAEQEVTLAELVKRRQEEGYSLREMEKRALGRGYRISHSHLADHASGAVRKVPDGESIDALAAALDMGIEDVRKAVMQQYWDYVPRELKGRRTSKVAAAVPPDISPEEEAEIIRMVEAWVIARRSG